MQVLADEGTEIVQDVRSDIDKARRSLQNQRNGSMKRELRQELKTLRKEV